MSSTLLQLHSAVTFQETVTSLIRRALDQNLLQHEDVDNFELLYMMSEDEKIKVSDHALVCLSMNLGIQYFIVRKRPQVKGKEFSESTCKSSRPLSHKQVGDTCLIRVHLETQSPEMAKSVLVTCQDRAPVVIRSALDLHFLTEENPEDYELGQIISRRQKLRIPAEANVFYAKNAHKKSNFVTFQETVTSLIRRALDQNLLQHEDVDNFELLYMMSEDEKIKVSDHALVCLSMNLGIQYFIVRKRPQVKGKEFSESTCKSSRPLSHKQVGDTCLIRVHLETQSPEMAKSVLVTCQDRAPVVIRSALDLHFLTEENPEDYELGQIISRRQKLRIPAEANVFYAKNAHKKSNFVTFQETVTSLIRRALDQNLLQHEDVDNFELLYMMSEDEKIKVSDHALVCLSMNLGIQYFIVRKRPQVKGKEFSESTCKSSRPLSHKQVGDTCLIRVHLETQSPEMAKSVLVTCQDRAPVVIRSALDLHFLTEENPEDYELGQIISRRQKLRIPAEANVFYAKNPHKKSNFVLRKRSLSQKNDGWIQPQPPSRPGKKAPALLRMLAKPFCCCVPGRG
ncbi:uncharacterized protein LOC144249840 [Urocitellus parryii]